MKYLITGITGTLGKAVSKILLEDPENTIIGVSRDEQKQRALDHHPRMTLVLGDIRDHQKMVEISRGVDLIFHFAALKCVDTLESQVDECIKTNVIGTQNILSAQKQNDIKRVVLSSTDKAAYPVNAYGNSKALAERMVLQDKNNVVCRYGNVIASRGSVVPMFAKTLKEQSNVFITNKKMTRFLILMEDAARFVVQQSKHIYGGVKTPEMCGASIVDVAHATSKILGIDSYDTVITGARPGEKIHECLRTLEEGDEVHSHTAPQFTVEDLVEILTPVVMSL